MFLCFYPVELGLGKIIYICTSVKGLWSRFIALFREQNQCFSISIPQNQNQVKLYIYIYIYIYIYMHLSEGTLVTFPVRSMSYCPQCVIRSISQSASKVVVSFLAFGFFREPWRQNNCLKLPWFKLYIYIYIYGQPPRRIQELSRTRSPVEQFLPTQLPIKFLTFREAEVSLRFHKIRPRGSIRIQFNPVFPAHGIV